MALASENGWIPSIHPQTESQEGRLTPQGQGFLLVGFVSLLLFPLVFLFVRTSTDGWLLCPLGKFLWHLACRGLEAQAGFLFAVEPL